MMTTSFEWAITSHTCEAVDMIKHLDTKCQMQFISLCSQEDILHLHSPQSSRFSVASPWWKSPQTRFCWEEAAVLHCLPLHIHFLPLLPQPLLSLRHLHHYLQHLDHQAQQRLDQTEPTGGEALLRHILTHSHNIPHRSGLPVRGSRCHMTPRGV